ncbi:MAG: M1 family metallopeptidase [Bacteroidetes bacterium]|nr:M1 family metallopeptidase [Bacteroidota bacterium]
MKRFLKWFFGILGGLLLVTLLVGGYLYYKYVGFGDYPSGGALSVNQAGYDVIHYDIGVEVLMDQKAIRGSCTVTIQSLSSLDVVELDLLDLLTVDSVFINEEPAGFLREHHKLRVPAGLRPGDISKVRVLYHGVPLEASNPPWRGGFNWSKDATGAHWIGLSCQGEGGKVWFPCKDHPSDEPDSARITVTIPENYVCASNGLLRSIDESVPGSKTFVWATNYPINNYDLNISIGRYSVVQRDYKTQDGRIMPLPYYVLPEDSSRARELVDMAADMLATYRKYFGEYPFAKEKFGLVQTDYYGMEHQTINAYGNKYRFKTVAGHSYDQLMLHEMGHEWWGNKVTAADWADFWIHEGLCCYAEALYHLDKTGESGYHEYIASLRKGVKNNKPIVLGKDISTSEAYHSDIYTKGGFLMNSLRYMMGDSLLFTVLRRFSNDSAYTYQHRVTTSDFVRLTNEVTGYNYNRFFDLFFYTTTIPDIEVKKTGGDMYSIRITNFDIDLPMDVETSKGTQRMMLSSTPVVVESTDAPVIDEAEWYLRTIRLVE